MRIERKSRVGIGGIIVAFVAVMLALGAINSGNNLLFIVFGVVIGSIIVSGVVSGSMLMGLRIERHPPHRMRVGERSIISYEVRNTARFSHAFALIVSEPSPDAARLLGAPLASEMHIPPCSSCRVRAPVTPTRRGLAVLDRVSVSSRFPVGFLEKTITAHTRATVIVHPRMVQLDREAIRAIAGKAAESSHTQRRAGSGDEFFGLREYSPGDPMRQIAWRASARTDTLVVRQNTQRRSRTLWILLDDTAPDEDAITLAASIAGECIHRDLSVGLATATRGSVVAAGRGLRHLTVLLDALATLEYDDDAPEIAWRGPGRGGCAVVHSRGGSLTGGPRDAIQLESGALERLARPRDAFAAAGSGGRAPA